MSKVLTVGTFDLYHAGHVNLIFQCAKISGMFTINNRADQWHNVTVGLNSDKFVEKYKGKRPIYTYDERYKLLLNNRYVWNILTNDTPTIEPLLKLEFDFLVIGSDWAQKDYYKQIGVDQNWLDKHGITLCYVPYTQGVSTTQLKERINAS